LGDGIVGEATHDNSSYYVALSALGSIVAVGAPCNDGNGEGSSHVRIFVWNNEG
jgi:hypothetical protein